MKDGVKLIASFFYLGYVPFVPGTVASACTLGFYFLIKDNFYFYSFLLLIVTILGFLVAGPAERIFQKKDASEIVIDEVAGLLLAFWGLKLDFTLIIVGFLIFRALDAIKVYPADKIEKMPGAWGIMGDDLFAGLYTNIVLRLVTGVFLQI